MSLPSAKSPVTLIALLSTCNPENLCFSNIALLSVDITTIYLAQVRTWPSRLLVCSSSAWTGRAENHNFLGIAEPNAMLVIV